MASPCLPAGPLSGEPFSEALGAPTSGRTVVSCPRIPGSTSDSREYPALPVAVMMTSRTGYPTSPSSLASADWRSIPPSSLRGCTGRAQPPTQSWLASTSGWLAPSTFIPPARGYCFFVTITDPVHRMRSSSTCTRALPVPRCFAPQRTGYTDNRGVPGHVQSDDRGRRRRPVFLRCSRVCTTGACR